jgi:hypothetical protein
MKNNVIRGVARPPHTCCEVPACNQLYGPGEDQAFCVGLVVVLITNGGMAFGIDHWLARSRARDV